MAFSISFVDEQSWYEENYEVEDAGEIETEDLEECEYKNMRSTFDLFEKLKKENEEADDKVNDLKKENEELKEENDELKETIYEIKKHWNLCSGGDAIIMIKKMEKENEELKEENEKWIKQSYTIGKLLEDKWFWFPGDTLQSVQRMKAKYDELKETIGKIKAVLPK